MKTPKALLDFGKVRNSSRLKEAISHEGDLA